MRFLTKMPIEAVMASAEDITYAINRYYGLVPVSDGSDRNEMALYNSIVKRD